jgi:NAD(P)H-hydrate epimerase
MYNPLPTPEEMNCWDEATQKEYSLLQEILMENAAREAMAVLLAEYGPVRDKVAVLLAGPGNNGGDAFALARTLVDHGARVSVFHVGPLDKYSGAAAYHLKLLQKLQLPLVPLTEAHLDVLASPDILVDGLLGTGLLGELRPEYQSWINYINRQRNTVFILSLDIPSGLDGRTGKPCPIAVRATATVSFEDAKIGLVLPEAKPYTGNLHVRPIGIPTAVKRRYPPRQYLLTRSVLDLIPSPDPLMHKGTAGRVLIVGGSPGLTGAPLLAALGALRAGAGLVTIACPRNLNTEVKSGWPEAMTMPLGLDAKWSKACAQELAAHAHQFDAMVLGPGLGRSPDAAVFVQTLLGFDLPPLIADADLLYHLAQDPDQLGLLPKNSILTPHPGEMAALCDLSIAQIQDNRVPTAREYAQKWNCVLVLKGAGTVIASPEGSVYLSSFATASLAVGGSGDVLCGVIGALLARGLPPLEAANTGVYWHGLAGAALEKSFSRRGNLAREIADMLPRV